MNIKDRIKKYEENIKQNNIYISKKNNTDKLKKNIPKSKLDESKLDESKLDESKLDESKLDEDFENSIINM
jgi:hypothetical protein